MRAHVIAYLSTAIVFLGLDYLWLSRIAIGFYRSQIGDLLRDRPNFTAAALFYLFYIGGIVYFAVLPGVAKASPTTTLLSAALLGFIAYGTYDMTNLATLRGWSLPLSIVDMLWGTVLTAVAAGAGYLALSAVK